MLTSIDRHIRQSRLASVLSAEGSITTQCYRPVFESARSKHMSTYTRCTRSGVIQHRPNRLPPHIVRDVGTYKTERWKLNAWLSCAYASRERMQTNLIDNVLLLIRHWETSVPPIVNKRTACWSKLILAITGTTTAARQQQQQQQHDLTWPFDGIAPEQGVQYDTQGIQ